MGALRDPRTGLYTGKFLERWTAGLGAGTRPIGLVLLRVFGVAQLREQYGLRAELAALAGVTRSVQDLLSATDRTIRIGREDFLVALPAAASVTVTRERPLPVHRLAREIESRPAPAPE